MIDPLNPKSNYNEHEEKLAEKSHASTSHDDRIDFPGAGGRQTTAGSLTDPDVATNRATAYPVAVSVGDPSNNQPNMPDPTPPERRAASPFPGSEYQAPPVNIPEQVSAADILAKSRERWDVGPADSEQSASHLAGTTIVERRQP
jgi:hypothetical protein